MSIATLLCALGLASIHLVAEQVHRLTGRWQSHWLSVAGGVSVAYVFVHVFPELRMAHDALKEVIDHDALKYHSYLLALVGLSAFYGLERWVIAQRNEDEQDQKSAFAVHIGAFALYNALIGYLITHREAPDTWAVVAYFLAMALHFLANDDAFMREHADRYRQWGRWVLSGAVLVGWGFGQLVPVSEALAGALFAVLAGAIVLNALKDELPDNRKGHFGAFVAGGVVYSVLLMFV
ncbi:MAG: hypothetical protein RhofKO_16360 [Rhodothermales bacterium]